MIWVVSFRRDGQAAGQHNARGRAAAIIAALGLIDRGLEVISVQDQHHMRSVSAEELRRVRDLRDAPVLRSVFGNGPSTLAGGRSALP